MKNTLFMLGVFFGILTLSACVEFQAFSIIENNLRELKGKPSKTAFNLLGFPDAESKIAGKTVYTWNTAYSYSQSIPTYKTTLTPSGSSFLTTSTIESTTNADCKIDIIVNKSNVIEDTKFTGNQAGCERYARRFSKKK